MIRYNDKLAVKPLKLLILGGGVAGFISAILRERNGHNVTLIKRNKE